MPQQVFAPVEVQKAAARCIVAPVTGNAYALDGRGTVLAQDADVAWLQTQGFTVAGGASAMYAPIDVSKALNRPVVSPITGTTYVLDGRGAAAIAPADVPWLRTQGYLAAGE